MGFSDFLVTDDLTILLGLITASIFLLFNLYKPQSLVHPILLGRQSDVSRVRNPGESAVHRNYGTGMLGRFPIRPTREIQMLLDHVKPEFDAPRTLWSTKISNTQLRERVAAFGTGLRRAGLKRTSNVLLLLDDSIEFLITDLALALECIPSFTLSSPALLASVLENHPPTAIVVDAAFLPHALELIYDTNELAHHVVIVAGEPDSKTMADASAHIRLVRWADIEAEGRNGEPSVPTYQPEPSTIFTVSFYNDIDGNLQAAQLTHQNITASVAAVRALLPLSSPMTALDTVVSAHSMSTAYGRSIAYTALHEGTNFGTLPSAGLYKSANSATPTGLVDLFSNQLSLPSPTILFIKPIHLGELVSAIMHNAKSSLLFSSAWRHKLAGIFEGYITKESLWDRLVFEDARVKVMGPGAATVRGVVVSDGPLNADLLTPARIALSVPLVNTFIHPLVASPIFASHPQDLQTFPKAASGVDASIAHVGPPVINIEAKMVGVDDAAVESGADPVGALAVRGPTVGKLLVDDAGEDDGKEEAWVLTGYTARAQTNGSFKVWVIDK